MYQALRGTQDILPAERPYWRYVTEEMHAMAALFGYQQIDTPILESTGLFVRGVGEGTDIVDKEMYIFQDKDGDQVGLRPEFTAGVMRAYIENGMHVLPRPVKLYSIGPIFRHEAPQAGRFRQHHQFNVEVLGELDPAVDLEIMSVAWTLLTRLGFRGLSFQLNSTGCPICRPGYRKALVDYFGAYEAKLNEVDRRRLGINPLRLLDSKEEAAQPLLDDAPHSIDYLCDECATHLATLRGYLDALEMPHTINFRLVRGLDYYTKTVFEVWAAGIGAQAAVCGGGRYDGLIEDAGRPAHARHRLRDGHRAGDPQPEAAGHRAAGAARADACRFRRWARRRACRRSSSCADLRAAGIGALLAFGGRSLKSQLKGADKAGVAYTLILGDQELADGVVVARDMASSQQETVALAGVVDWLRAG